MICIVCVTESAQQTVNFIRGLTSYYMALDFTCIYFTTTIELNNILMIPTTVHT